MELSLIEIVAIIRRKLWLIILVAFVFGAAAAVWTHYFVQPQYKAQASIIVDKAPDNKNDTVQYNDVMMYQKLVTAYVEIAQSDSVAEGSVQRLGLSITPDALKKKITVTPNQNTWVLYIAATDRSPEEAAKIANGVSDVFIEKAGTLINSSSVLHIIDYAKAPASPVKPRPLMDTAIAVLLGIMLSISIILLLEYMDNTVKSIEQIEEITKLPVVGIIPRAE